MTPRTNFLPPPMSFNWPRLPGQSTAPVWRGEYFSIGSVKTQGLCYHETKSGWSNELTRMNEEVVGSNHYIDKASRKNAIRSLFPVLKQSSPTILEVGCSSGFLLEDLRLKAKH